MLAFLNWVIYVFVVPSFRTTSVGIATPALIFVFIFITGPLNAVVIAQGAAASTTLNFIRTVGFNSANQTVNVGFQYQAYNATTGQINSYSLTVPLLTLMPIPYIRVRDSTWWHVPC